MIPITFLCWVQHCWQIFVIRLYNCQEAWNRKQCKQFIDYKMDIEKDSKVSMGKKQNDSFAWHFSNINIMQSEKSSEMTFSFFLSERKTWRNLLSYFICGLLITKKMKRHKLFSFVIKKKNMKICRESSFYSLNKQNKMKVLVSFYPIL